MRQRFVALMPDPVDPAMLDPALSSAHLAYLQRHAARIRAAGGLRPPDGGAFCGALWVIEATDADEARQLLDSDPYSVAGLWPNRQLWRWNHAPIQSKGWP